MEHLSLVRFVMTCDAARHGTTDLVTSTRFHPAFQALHLHLLFPATMSSSSATTNAQTSGRSYYEGDVDFDTLAAKDADFAAICKVSKDKRWIDFQDPRVVQYAPPFRTNLSGYADGIPDS